jgi:glucose/arabinose dehydrogenase
LLGIAFHPHFARQTSGSSSSNTDLEGSLRISEFGMSFSSPDVGDRPSERVLLTITHPGASNHNGGQLAFGRTVISIIGVGDGGSAGDPPNNAQNLSVLLGKILRIRRGRRAALRDLPHDNPFVGTEATRAARSGRMACENPWRFSFDRMTGDLFVGDVGQGAREEIELCALGQCRGGMNFGWRVFEGFECFNPSTNCSAGREPHTPPIPPVPARCGRGAIP